MRFCDKLSGNDAHYFLNLRNGIQRVVYGHRNSVKVPMRIMKA